MTTTSYSYQKGEKKNSDLIGGSFFENLKIKFAKNCSKFVCGYSVKIDCHYPADVYTRHEAKRICETNYQC